MHMTRGIHLEDTLMVKSQSSDPSRVLAFDGLRALAVLAVMVQHNFAVPANLVTSLGPVGVRLFFVLSGFLITRILITARSEAEAAGVSMSSVWRAFLVRRALRIFPLAYLALTVAWLLGAPAMTQYSVWYWLYAGNIARWLFGEVANAGLGHWWSLAIEEHFYLFWPAVILLLPRRAWQPMTVAVLVVAALARVIHSGSTDDELWPAYVLTWCRMDALAFGALLAMRRMDGPYLLVLGVTIFGVGNLLDRNVALAHTLCESAFVFLSGALVVGVSQGTFPKILGCRPLVLLGSISYGMYVWGGLVKSLVLPAVARAIRVPILDEYFGWWPFLINGLATLLLSTVSWRYLEQPLTNLKRYFPYVTARKSDATAPPPLTVAPAAPATS
jgi:peptidoglycan/LPS O-acetylase OafA/YrhL